MGIEDWVKSNAKWAVPVVLILIGFYVYNGEGQILSQNVSEWAVIGGIGGIWYVFSLLKKEIEIEQSKPPEIKIVEKPAQPQEGKPFDFDEAIRK